MKRLFALALACTLALCASVQADAQRFGVIGGATFSSLSNVESASKTGWSLGGTVSVKLPLGFSVQPSLVYNSKVSQLGGHSSADIQVGYLELPVSLQWGPDLLIFRPFLDVSPYLGYALESQVSSGTLLTQEGWRTSNLQRFEYGLGLGGGIEVWRIQLLCRYNWNFGSLFSDQGKSYLEHIEQALANKNFGGVTLSLAFLFGK